MKPLFACFALVFFSFSLTAAAQEAESGPYDLLFKNGTLDEMSHAQALAYQRSVTNNLNPEAAERDTGEIVITFPDDGRDMAHLEFHQDGKHRPMGEFPASVGNPMIMVFYENTVRDMAETAGGSPFYIRNRVKEALVKPAEIETGEEMIGGKSAEVTTIRMKPFANDANRERMKGFGDLVLSVTVSEAAPGWYVRLVADATPEAGGEPVYHSEISFSALRETSE